MFKIFSSDPVHDPIKKQAPATEIKKTTCYMCACRCGIRAHMRDGKLVEVDYRDPAAELRKTAKDEGAV